MNRNHSVLGLVGLLFLALDLISELGVSLLDEGESDSFSLWQRDSWGLSITNDLDVLDSGGESVSALVLDVSNVEGTLMSLNRLEDSNSADVVSTGEHDQGSVLELDDLGDLLGVEVQLN